VKANKCAPVAIVGHAEHEVPDRIPTRAVGNREKMLEQRPLGALVGKVVPLLLLLEERRLLAADQREEFLITWRPMRHL
jgi:hypothetical protein